MKKKSKKLSGPDTEVQKSEPIQVRTKSVWPKVIIGGALLGGTYLLIKKGSGLGAVADYDIITIKGKQYSVNQIVDKELIATAPTKVYNSAFDNATVKYTTQAGQSLGKVYSYLLPTTGRSGSWLMIVTGPTTAVYVPADSADPASLKNQGAKTVDQEVKEEADAKLKEDSPIEYYVKKYAGKVLLVGALVYGGVELGKAVIQKKL